MSLADFYAREIVTISLATSRISGVAITAPFPGEHVPARIKVGFVFLFAFLVTTTVPPANAQFDMSLAGLGVAELGIGIVMGLAIRIVFSVAETIGSNISQSLGLTMAHIFDPTTGSDDSVAGRFVTLLGMLLFFSIGAHRVFLAYVLESFRAVPIGQGLSFVNATPLLVDQVGASLAAGVHLGLPIIVVGLAVQMTLAFVSRAAPQLQVFNVGASVGLGGGMLVTIACFSDIADGLVAELAGIGPRIEALLGAIANP